eukprot:CAMPEP_0184488902 /NCGR_PEP_ID=MMETSP0113_2-20130426/13923_1 /TAXON_ID=91329 /ORGANISM="Norrisiella sphaerica, Strain BC52" /LENGTH=653 /DNA_ID=CAMNT_0026872037 /DNA_START=31 /DNA_END=1992 /DNA_ORIENTATION=-
MVALLLSMVFLGYRFASAVNATADETLQKLHAKKLFDKWEESNMPIKRKIATVEEKLRDLSMEVATLTSLLNESLEKAKPKSSLETRLSDLRVQVNSLRQSFNNMSVNAMETMQAQKKSVLESLESQYRNFEDKYRQVQDSLRGMEGRFTTYVEENFNRHGSVHRWIAGVDSEDARAIINTKSSSPDSSNINAISAMSFPSEMTISWRSECGCTGIGLEAMNLVYPLWKAGVKIWLNKCDKGCDYAMPHELKQMVESMDKTRPKSPRRSYYSQSQNQRHIYDIVVLHIAYAGICSTKDDEGDGRYVISRSMYEADSIKKSEVERCNSDSINEVWVPTEFNVDGFARAGVNPAKLYQIGEGIDMYETWNPEKIKNINVLAKLGIENTKAGWNFFSLFKFERRKNWKGLLESYLTEFSNKDDVCFFLKTHEGWEGNPEDWIKRYLRELMSKKIVNSKTLPCIYLIDSMIDASLLPNLFHEMDAFLLPSHAEGWGLPALEAMAMELPIAVTDWGGVTQFSSGYSASDRKGRDKWGRFPGGYAIRVSHLEPAFDGNGAGQWAVPSVSHLRQIMRHMFENQETARESGKLGRQRALKYDRNAVAARILRNFNEIYTDIVAPKVEAAAKKSQQTASTSSSKPRSSTSGTSRTHYLDNDN